MPNNDYANEPNQSRSEDIIQSILDNTEYDEPARSRIEYLLVELKKAIEGGGGGGGVTSYSPLTEKPKIDNHTLQAGNNTSSDLGLQTKLTFDSAPTENSTNPVTSGGVYTALGTKASSSDVYNKSAVDTALSAKADKSTTYTKTEVDTALSSKQNTISDLSTIRSGAALGATAVQPVSGKGLSTNDYTNDEKSKLAGIEAQANKTTVDSALSGTSTNPVQNKVVKSALDGKQATLTTAQLAAVNSGITSTDVEQIATNKNNILFTATIGECESTGNTANKVVTVSDVNYTPHKGSIIAVKFKYGNNVADTAEHPITLNVNNTGAYRIWYKNGDYVNASQGKIFGFAGYYIYYMFDGVDRWLWVNYGMDNAYSAMQQSEASAGTSTTERLITAKVLSDTIDEKIDPLENNILTYAIPTCTDTAFTTSTTGEYVYTGISFTVPSGEVWEFFVADKYNGSGATNFSNGLLVSDSSSAITNVSVIAENTQTPSVSGISYWVRQLTGITPKRTNATTYYVWTNRAVTTGCNIFLCLRRVF